MRQYFDTFLRSKSLNIGFVRIFNAPLTEFLLQSGGEQFVLLPLISGRLIPVGRTGISHGLCIFLEYLDHLGASGAFFGGLIPEFERRIFNDLPLIAGNRGELQFATLGAVVRLTPPIPMLPIVVGAVHLQKEKGL